MRTTSILTLALALATASSAAELKVPITVALPQLEPIVSPCADPAADRFLELDLFQRPPAGATRVQRIGGWVTPDGIFHWPFAMRVRNLGDQPFLGKPGEQAVTIVEDDHVSGTKGRVVSNTPFAQIPAHGSLSARFEFSAPADQVEKGKFRRTYTLKLAYKTLDGAIANGKTGDCNLRNNTFSFDLDGSKKSWFAVQK